MIDDIIQDAKSRMAKSVETLRHELTKLRTGRAHTSLLDHITVDYYGSEVPLKQVANVNVEDARTLIVTPWEKPMVSGDREGHYEIRSRPEPEHGRHGDAHPVAAADRRTSPRHDQSGAPRSGGRARGDPQHPSRCQQ